MATTWQDILDLGDRDATPRVTEEAGAEGRGGMFKRLRESLSKSRQALADEISASLFDQLDGETWERLEEALILADAGAPTTAKVVERLEHEVEAGNGPSPGAARRGGAVQSLPQGASSRRGPLYPRGGPAGGRGGGGHRNRQ